MGMASDDFTNKTVQIKHPFGIPASIITFNVQNQDNSSIQVDFEALDLILLHPEVKDRQIVVISIVGAFRKGKSYFLNYCLRFLYANYKSVSSKTKPSGKISEWMGHRDEPLTGFTFKAGHHRDTTGMLFWSDVFLHDDEFKGKIAIVVMDTQGLFDSKTPPADNTKIFALGTLISSIQMYNLNGVVQEDHLQYLQLATDFARLAETNDADRDTKAFQNLVFLIRDWDHLHYHPAGIEGGKGYLKDLLEINDEQSPTLRTVREYIHRSFNKISCYLLPEPGKIVRRNKNYNGEWSKMDEDFKNALNDTIIDILKPSELIPKRINGNVLKASELRDFMAVYFQAIESGETPKIESIYDITVRSQMNILLRDLLLKYKELLTKNVNFADPSFIQSIEINHEMYKNYTMLLYKSSRKMGSVEHKKLYQEQLDANIDETYNNWKEMAMQNYEALQEQIRETQREVKKKEELRKKLEDELRNTQDKIQEITNTQLRTNSKHDEEIKNLLESLQKQQTATLEAQNAQKAIEQKAQEAVQAVKEANENIKQLKADKVNTDKAVAEKLEILNQYNEKLKEFNIQQKKQLANSKWIQFDSAKVYSLIFAGYYYDNKKNFVCRIKHDNGEVYNGEFPNDKQHQSCYITFNGKQYSSKQFEILRHFESSWIEVTNQVIPTCAVEGSGLNSGEILYICRVYELKVGRVEDGVCKIPIYNTTTGEATFNTYQILCVS
ncbi:unnamed protein product [Diamesa hyperborea]